MHCEHYNNQYNKQFFNNILLMKLHWDANQSNPFKSDVILKAILGNSNFTNNFFTNYYNKHIWVYVAHERIKVIPYYMNMGLAEVRWPQSGKIVCNDHT